MADIVRTSIDLDDAAKFFDQHRSMFKSIEAYDEFLRTACETFGVPEAGLRAKLMILDGVPANVAGKLLNLE